MINEIPLSLIPGNYVSIDGSQAIQGLSSQRARVLLFGTKLSGGTATALVPVKITREDQGDDLFGVGTPLAEMCRLFRKHNKISELTVIPQAEAGGGAKASNTVTFTGTATASRLPCTSTSAGGGSSSRSPRATPTRTSRQRPRT
jgi:Mu-like prophage tail sheath protein gpL